MLMMHQPLIGWDFTTYLPAALVPYMLLLVFNVFNRIASLFTRSDSMEFEDDFETQSGAAARGMQLLLMELENFNAGRPLGLTISVQGRPPAAHSMRCSAHTPSVPESTRAWQQVCHVSQEC